MKRAEDQNGSKGSHEGGDDLGDDLVDDLGVVVVEAASGGARVLLLCDHASCCLPRGLGGVPDRLLLDHYGWDIGALGVSRVVARELGAGLVWSNVSRLVIDPNRGLASADLIRQDLGIAMNAGLDIAEQERRIALFYEPYHRAISDVLDEDGGIVGIVAIHTFTPMLEGERRVLEAGLIYDVARGGDVRCASLLGKTLREEGFSVGDNEPYPRLAGDSLERHSDSRGIVGLGIEVRNDLVGEGVGQEEWGVRLARGIGKWLEERTEGENGENGE